MEMNGGKIFGLLAGAGLGLVVAAFGLDTIGPAIDRNTKALFIILILAGLGSMIGGARAMKKATPPAAEKPKEEKKAEEKKDH